MRREDALLLPRRPAHWDRSHAPASPANGLQPAGCRTQAAVLAVRRLTKSCPRSARQRGGEEILAVILICVEGKTGAVGCDISRDTAGRNLQGGVRMLSGKKLLYWGGNQKKNSRRGGSAPAVCVGVKPVQAEEVIRSAAPRTGCVRRNEPATAPAWNYWIFSRPAAAL